MLSTTTAYDAKHALLNKSPLYVVSIDGCSFKICNNIPLSPTGTHKRYLNSISGNDQKIRPENGTATIGGIKVDILDVDGEFTTEISSDATNFHRAKVTVKAGYVGMNESDLIEIPSTWITKAAYKPKKNSWILTSTDPQKWLQKTIFRTASEASPIVFLGNPINILLSVLTSSDAGTNSDYDLGDDDLGCGLDSDSCDIASIEQIRNSWYWGQTHNMFFSITESVTAKEFIEKEILKVLNCYPGITGAGKYKIIRLGPNIKTTTTVQSFDEDVILPTPELDLNFDGMYNEVEYSVDWDGDEFANIYYFVDSASYSARGNAKAPIKIESKGLKSSMSPGSSVGRAVEIVNRRALAVFQRFAAPPPAKIKAKTQFFQHLTEAGDIVPFTHSDIPDIRSGSGSVIEELLEVTSRKIDYKNGVVAFNFLATGFRPATYSAYSPFMTITAAASSTSFTVSVADAAKWTQGWEAKIVNANLLSQAVVTILTINKDTGAITCDSIGATPGVGWYVMFADYDACTSDQKLFAFMADGSDNLGAANDDAQLLAA